MLCCPDKKRKRDDEEDDGDEANLDRVESSTSATHVIAAKLGKTGKQKEKAKNETGRGTSRPRAYSEQVSGSQVSGSLAAKPRPRANSDQVANGKPRPRGSSELEALLGDGFEIDSMSLDENGSRRSGRKRGKPAVYTDSKWNDAKQHYGVGTPNCQKGPGKSGAGGPSGRRGGVGPAEHFGGDEGDYGLPNGFWSWVDEGQWFERVTALHLAEKIKLDSGR
jgi:hypothetical protein